MRYKEKVLECRPGLSRSDEGGMEDARALHAGQTLKKVLTALLGNS